MSVLRRSCRLITCRILTPKFPSTTTTSPRAITQLFTITSTGSPMVRFSSIIDPTVSFSTSLSGTCARPKEMLTGNCTSSSRSKVFAVGSGAGAAGASISAFSSLGFTSDHSRIRPALFHVGAQPQNRLRLQLRNARFVQIHDLRNLAQRQLLVIVEAEHGFFDGGHLGDRLGQQILQFRALRQVRGPLGLVVGNEFQ